MIVNFFTFSLLVLCALIKQSEADGECVPKSVTNLTLSTDHILSWLVRDDEECEILQFYVYIFHDNYPEWNIAVYKLPYLHVSFLDICREYTFVVIPVTPDKTEGRELRLVGTLPVPTSADLNISYINITRSDPLNEIHLEWGLADSHLVSCSIQYRFTVEIEGNPYIEDMYLTEKTINLNFLSPCSTYLFGVRAINVGSPTIEGPLKTESYYIPPQRQGSPRLKSLTPTYDGFNSTWEVESVVRNKCLIKQFYLDGGVQFREMLDLNELDDGRGPIEVSVTGLKADTMYYFEAYLINTAGYSTPARVAVLTLSFTDNQELSG